MHGDAFTSDVRYFGRLGKAGLRRDMMLRSAGKRAGIPEIHESDGGHSAHPVDGRAMFPGGGVRLPVSRRQRGGPAGNRLGDRIVRRDDTMAARGAGREAGDDRTGGCKATDDAMPRVHTEVVDASTHGELGVAKRLHHSRRHRIATIGALAKRVVAKCWQARHAPRIAITPPVNAPTAPQTKPIKNRTPCGSGTSNAPIPSATPKPISQPTSQPITSRPINARSPSNAAADPADHVSAPPGQRPGASPRPCR